MFTVNEPTPKSTGPQAPYDVVLNGISTQLMLTDEQAIARGLTPKGVLDAIVDPPTPDGVPDGENGVGELASTVDGVPDPAPGTTPVPEPEPAEAKAVAPANKARKPRNAAATSE